MCNIVIYIRWVLLVPDFFYFKWISKYCVFDIKEKVSVSTKKRQMSFKILYGSLKEALGPCLNYLVSWPALLQNRRQTLILGLETAEEQPWEVILLCVAIPAEFSELYNEQKWTGKDTWKMKSESLLIDCGYRGLAPRSLPSGFNRIKLLHFKAPQNPSYQGRQRGTSAYLCTSLFPWGAPVWSTILHWHHLICTTAMGILPLH